MDIVNFFQVKTFGMARFDGDKDVESVFTRADQLMYKHKAQLKA
jgi:hypothetical protein